MHIITQEPKVWYNEQNCQDKSGENYIACSLIHLILPTDKQRVVLEM